MSIPRDADFVVRGYDRSGLLLLETWHRGEWSKDMEVSCWLERRKRGDDVGKVEIEDRTQFKVTQV